jgi:hypothetical protein
MTIKFYCGEDSYCGLNLTLCSVEAGYQCFIWTYCLYLQGTSWILWLYGPLQHCFAGPLDYVPCKTQNETIIRSSLSRMYVQSFYCHHGSSRDIISCDNLQHSSPRFCMVARNAVLAAISTCQESAVHAFLFNVLVLILGFHSS